MSEGRGQNSGWEERQGIRWRRSWGFFSTKRTSEIFNLALINSCLLQAEIELSYMATPLCWVLLHALQEIWFIHLPIVDGDWSTLLRAAQRIDFWQSMIHLLKSPHSSLTLLQINLKAEPDSPSHRTPYKQPFFSSESSICLVCGLQNRHIPVKTSCGL